MKAAFPGFSSEYRPALPSLQVGRGGGLPIRANVWYGDSRRYRSIHETSADYGHYWLVCDQSSTSSEDGRDPCRGAIGEGPTGSHQQFIVPGQGLPLGIASHCPRPLRGRGRRPQAGRGGGFAVSPPAGRGDPPIGAIFPRNPCWVQIKGNPLGYGPKIEAVDGSMTIRRIDAGEDSRSSSFP